MDPDERQAPEAPESRSATQTVEALAADSLIRQFAAVPGEARHGVTALRSVELEYTRNGADSGSLGTLHGHFAVFNRWTKINSIFEGKFMERIAPGAFKKTFTENRNGIRCLFQHGRDPSIGMKVLGTIRDVGEDTEGARYEVPLDETSYNRDLLPGLRSGQYGASFRFEVLREEVVTHPERSDHNPEGIEERTIVECRVREFGPVTFGAYSDATSGVRAVTDDYLLEMQRDIGPELLVARMAERVRELQSSGDPSPAEPATEETPPAERSEESSSAEETTGEGEQRESEGTPETEAPDLRSTEDRVGTTRLSSAVQPLRTSQDMEEKPWRL